MSKRILVVEDSQFMRRRIVETLEKAGYAIVADVNNGTEAVSLYQQYKPDLVTMDVTMQGKDGLTAAAEILRYDPEAKIIFLTILNDPEIREKMLKIGAFGVVNKKNAQEVLDLIANC